MKAAILEKYGDVDSIHIKEIKTPSLASDELLVKVEAAALNPKDILIRKGKFKMLSGKKFPQQIGFDFAGVVLNSNNSKLDQGDKVFGMLNGWHGRCCAEFLNIKYTELYKIPDNISFEAAAGIPLAGQTALQAIRDKGQLKPNQTICINGASGGVGTLAIQIAKIMEGKVTTISSQRNIELCKTLGADVAIDYKKTNIIKSDMKYDIFFDVFGNYSYQKCAKILNAQGIYITTVPKPEIVMEQLRNFFRRKKAKLIMVKSNAEDIKWLYDNIKNNWISPVIDTTFELNEIGIAQKYIETKRAKGKVIIKINS
jgi:NADPH:quinone reductase-like Zn-dependent oxidoreductase